MGAGAGTGVLVPVLMQKYVDPQYPSIFGIKPSVLIPIATGAVGIGVGMFTNLIKNDTLNNFVIMYGFTALIGGIVSYATTNLGLFRGARQASSSGRYMNVQNPYRTPSKVPSVQNWTRQIGQGTSGVAGGVIYS